MNATRAFQELILDWPLLHRTAGDLRLSRCGHDRGKEPTGVNLFAVISA
ncbi:MAG TPA: hypothetical protein VGM14_27495 [Streptosporangiaceae bacterium]